MIDVIHIKLWINLFAKFMIDKREEIPKSCNYNEFKMCIT